MMDDTLRSDLLEWLVAWSARASLCVTLGTSLCGMTSDEIPRGAAERFGQGQGEGLASRPLSAPKGEGCTGSLGHHAKELNGNKTKFHEISLILDGIKMN